MNILNRVNCYPQNQPCAVHLGPTLLYLSPISEDVIMCYISDAAIIYVELVNCKQEPFILENQ